MDAQTRYLIKPALLALLLALVACCLGTTT